MEVVNELIRPSATWEDAIYHDQLFHICFHYLGDVDDTTATCMSGRPGSFVNSGLP